MSLPAPVKSMLLLGPTGAGKTPLGRHMEVNGFNGRKCFHFDFGHQMRIIAGRDNLPDGLSSAEHSFIRRVLDGGLLLENEHFHIAGKVINLFLRGNGLREGDVLILNGLPRHIDQAKGMAGMVEVEGLIVLECPEEDVYRRICENTGNDRAGRVDDNIAMVRRKLEIFKQRTEPLIDYFSNTGCKIVRIKVTASSTTENLYSDLISLSRIF